MSRGPGLQERVEGSTPGRVVISLAIMIVLVAVLVTNLPANSSLRQSLAPRTQPILNAIGLDQNWGVFAPDPRRQVLDLRATINFPDGSSETWRFPVRDDLVGSYSDYRWQKLMENVINDNGGPLAVGAAIWIAREQRSRPERPTSVTLTKRVAELPPPGPQAGEPLRFTESVALNQRITAKMLDR